MGLLMRHGARNAKLSSLLEGISHVDAANERDISGLSLDSRRTCPGDLFLACAGSARYGSEFIEHAIRAGAIAVAYEAAPSTFKAGPDDTQESLVKASGIPMFRIAGLKQQAGIIASRFYGHPSHDMFVIGITGTNGKTSCCHFLAQALSSAGHACGVIGTLGYGLYGSLQPGEHTTPDPVTLQSQLADMRDMGVQNVAMEVSSHGLDQGRVAGTIIDAAIFTNLSHEHLDYHGDISTYALAKQRLFASPQLRFAVINSDDEYGRRIIATLPAGVKLLSYSVIDQRQGADQPRRDRHAQQTQVVGRLLRMDHNGLEMHVVTPWGEGRIHSFLLGRFNASNLLAALAMLILMDMPLEEAMKKLADLRTVPGRMEYFRGQRRQPLVVVDYAHTPDALKQVLQTLREHCQGQLWCVFGCGGDRDKSKRPLMGSVAERYADHVVITDDNPRFEDAGQIIAHILAGMAAPAAANVMRDRKEAISYAIQHAVAGDIVLIAGKGHEEYQLVGDQKLSFSDRRQVCNLLKEVA